MDALVLETLPWLDTFRDECPDEVDQVKRAMIGMAMREWAGRPIQGERPQPVDYGERLPRGVCAWCFEPLGNQRSDFNGGTGHPECARHAYRCIAGEGAAPWPMPPEPSTYQRDPLIPFCRRLGREAARLGIDPQKLAQAIGRARCA